jgi:GTP-binding protein HflX
VNEVLAEIGAESIPQIIVYNKIDRLQRPAAIERGESGMPSAVWISAEKRLGLELLTSAIAERLSRFARRARVRLPAGAGALRSRLYAAKAVREERTAEDGSIELTVELPDVEIHALERIAGVRILEGPGADIPCASRDGYLESRTA